MEDTSKENPADSQKNGKSKSKSIWTIDKEEMERQISQYHTLKMHQSYRGISALILTFGVVLSSIILLVQGVSIVDVLIGAIIASILIYFVFCGHRWAIALILISFTANLLLTTFERMVEGTFSVSTAILFGGIWILVVSTLIKAIRVENNKRKHNLPKVGAIENLVEVVDTKSSSKPVVVASRKLTLKHWIITLVGLAIVGGGTLFWWYEIRVAEIKRECSWVERVEAEKPATPGMTQEEADRLNTENRNYNDNKPECSSGDSDALSRTARKYLVGCKPEDYRQKDPTPYIPENRYYAPATDREYELCLRHKGLQ